MLRFFALAEPGSYSVVRAAVLLRAAVGVATGCAQVLARSPGSRKKVRAWAEVARSSATAGPRAVREAGPMQYLTTVVGYPVEHWVRLLRGTGRDVRTSS